MESSNDSGVLSSFASQPEVLSGETLNSKFKSLTNFSDVGVNRISQMFRPPLRNSFMVMIQNLFYRTSLL